MNRLVGGYLTNNSLTINMESRIQAKINEHQRALKLAVQDWIRDNGATITKANGSDGADEFLQMMFDFEGLVLEKEDFQRRKRMKNHVPRADRCCAKRANGEQCTRRKLDGDFCGTHKKGAPHGVVSLSDQDEVKTTSRVEIWMHEFSGINYFIDKEHHVYSPESIVSNKQNPEIIGTWSSIDGTNTNLELKLA